MSIVLPIETDDRFRIITASAGQTVLAITFPWQDDNDVRLLKADSIGDWQPLTRPSDFTLTGAGNSAGGSATLAAAAAAGDRFLALGSAVLDRLSSIVREGRFSSKNIDDEMDRNRIIQQEQSRDLARALVAEYGQSGLVVQTGIPDNSSLVKNGGKVVPGPDPFAEEAARKAGDEALKSLIGQAGPVEVPLYDSRLAVGLAVVKPTVNAIRTSGAMVAGDGGAAIYKRSATEPSQAGKVQSADGAWWEIEPATSKVSQFYIGVSYEDSTVALERAFNSAMQTGKHVEMPHDRDLFIRRPIEIKPVISVTRGSKESDIHFDNCRPARLFGQGRHTIKASPDFAGASLLRFVYNVDIVDGLAPQWSEIQGLTLDGMDVADLAMHFDYCMNSRIQRVGVRGVDRVMKFTGYGGAEISRCAFRAGSAGIELLEGGGDSWIEKCDFYCTGWGVNAGPRGGNLVVEDCVFSRQDNDVSTSVFPLGVRLTGADNDPARDVRILNNEFCGMEYGVVATGHTGTRNMTRLRIIGNHTIPSAGGYLHTNGLAQITRASSVVISNNQVGSDYMAPSGALHPQPAVSLTDVGDISVSGNVMQNLLRPALIASNVSAMSFQGNIMANVAREGASSSALYLDSVVDSIIDGNIARQDSASYGQTMIVEVGASTRNFGRNLKKNMTVMATLAGGSTSSYT